MDEINDATDRVIAGLEGRPLQAGDKGLLQEFRHI